MIDEIDLLMEYNKDLSRKEAEKIVEKNKESRDEQINGMFGEENQNEEENLEEKPVKEEENDRS